MGPGFVVVAEVLDEQRLEMSSRDDEEVIEALLADGPHEPLGESVRPRRGDRGSKGLNPDGGKHRVESCGELGVAIADEEAEVTPGVLEVGRKVAGHLGHPGTVGVGGDTEQVHPSSVDLNYEEHVEAAQRDRVDGQEVGSQDAFGLGTQELAPGGARTPRRGREAMTAENGSDACLGNGNAELLELTDDAEVTPARILPCQADDQLDGSWAKAGRPRLRWR